MSGWLGLAGWEPARDDYGWEVDGSDQYLAVPNLTSRLPVKLCLIASLLMIKPTKCTNLSHLFLEENSTCFGQFLCPSSGVFHCTHSNSYFIRFADSLWAGSTPSWSCSQAVSKPVWHKPLLCVQWKTPDDGQRNCPKHVEFSSKNKFEKLVHQVSFIIRIYHDARSPERQIAYLVKGMVWT